MLVVFNQKAVFSWMNSCYIKQINSVEKEGKLENFSSYQTKANTLLHEISWLKLSVENCMNSLHYLPLTTIIIFIVTFTCKIWPGTKQSWHELYFSHLLNDARAFELEETFVFFWVRQIFRKIYPFLFLNMYIFSMRNRAFFGLKQLMKTNDAWP